MLSVLTKEGYTPIENRQNYYIEMNYDGFHQLCLDVSNNDKICKHLINEAVIKNEDNRFLIKDVNRRTQNTTYTCELDLDEWKETIFFDTANDDRFKTKSLGDILDVIKPMGWKITNASIRSIKRTPELKDATPFDILVSLQELFSVVYDIRVLTKEIYIINPESVEYDGLYATDELNMKKVTWQGSSSEFCTKLFAYGKVKEDGSVVNVSSINGGKEYIEDHTYTDKVVTLVWRDERYIEPQSLLDDAKKKISKICVPKMSYDVTIYDLAQVNKDYDFLQFGLYKQVKTFVNKDISLLQRVVTYKKFYDKHDKNVVTLSNEQQKFTSNVSSVLGGNSNTTVNGSILEQAKKESAQIINDFATKGLKYETENETYFLDKLPKEAAKFVMRQNLGGIAFSQNGWSGPYITAWTIDGKFNASFITTGILKAIRIEAAEIFGGSININDKFIVDENGKLKCVDGEFSGEIIGGTITGNTTIRVGTDLTVGDNIYVGQNQSTGFINEKIIYFTDKSYISREKINANEYLSIVAKSYAEMKTSDGIAKVEAFDSGASMQCSGNVSNSSQVWVGTEGAGIATFDEGRNIGIYSESDVNIAGKNISIHCGTDGIVLEPKDGAYSAFFVPYSSGLCTLGSMANRFYRVYARYSEDATSDKRQKKDFTLFDERYIKFVDMLIPTLYRFIEQDEEKNLQSGFIAQEVLSAMEECKIDRKEFGAVKHSEWVDKETGEEKDEYSLVYAMFIPLLTYYIQFKNKSYEDRLSRIEKILKEKGVIE